MRPVSGQALNKKLAVFLRLFLVASSHHTLDNLVVSGDATLRVVDSREPELIESFLDVVNLLKLYKCEVEVLEQRSNFIVNSKVAYLLMAMLQGPMFFSKNSANST